ncbi:MAG: CHAT domain-containing protein, partial [Candidatus Aminicenantes bacterium]|nr:CHAT domain-containing protein [Candidatus Aminicenantes bacterium]
AMKARVFLDQMGEGLAPLEKGLREELKEKRDNLLGKLSYLTKQMQETGGTDEKKLEELKKEYHKVESEFEELLIKIRLDNPLYAGVKYPQPVTVQDVQENVLKPGEALISYFISQDTLYAFIVSKDIFKVKTIKIGEKDVSNLVKRYNDTLTEKTSFTRHCAALYDKLFQPLEKYLKPGADIIIAPDGELAKIPFETFVAGKNDQGQTTYLLEKYNIKYIQSASLLSLLRKYYKRDSASQNFIGFGDPVYDYKSFQAGKKERSNPAPARCDEISELFRDQYKQDKGAFGRLQASGEEVKTIADLFKNKEYRSVSYLRKDATEEKAKAVDMRDFDYIHFSCHGILGEMFQGLALSQIPGAAEDGYFTLNEVMNCDYHAKLIVLSACQTGSGKLQKGEGVTGLTRAFMYAGSPAVVAGLWKVDDLAAKELMIKFYRNMIDKKMSKPEALRQAKLALIKDGKFASPYYWSAFVLYGE